MKSIFILIIGFVFFLNMTLMAGESTKTNDYVKTDFTVKVKENKSITNGELIITFKPKEGIHINLDPPITINFDSSCGVVSVGKLETQKTKEYLDISKPIKQQFKLIQNVNSRKIILKGILSYFYCSAVDGWCSRFKQPFELNVKSR